MDLDECYAGAEQYVVASIVCQGPTTSGMLTDTTS